VKFLAVLFLSLFSVSAFAKIHSINITVLTESKTHKAYELHILSNDIRNTPRTRRLIREAVLKAAPNYSIEEVLANRDLIRGAIKKNLETKNISGNIAVFQVFRDKTGILSIR
jgi:hypothetical protein